MTETAERAGKRVRSIRMHDQTWDLMESRRGMTASTLINDMTEAGLGFARCYRCFEPVPVEFGDLAGKPLAEWVAGAGKAVTAQHRTGHRPVTIGNGADAATSPEPKAAPGSAVFQEPGGRPVVAALGESADSRRARGEALIRELELNLEEYRATSAAAGAPDGRKYVDMVRDWDSKIRQYLRERGVEIPEKAAPAVFLEPGGKPVIAAAAVPQVPASRSKRGRRP